MVGLIGWVRRVTFAAPILWLLWLASVESAGFLAAEFHSFQAQNLRGFERYLELEAAAIAAPRVYDYTRNLGWAEWDLGRRRIAESLWVSAALRRPTQPHPWDELGRTLARTPVDDDETPGVFLEWSLRQGASERDLIVERARLAIDQWPGVPGSWRARVFPEFLAQALAVEPLRVQAYAFLQKRESVLCGLPSAFAGAPTDLPAWCAKIAEHRQLCEGVLAHTRRVEDWCRHADTYWRSAL